MAVQAAVAVMVEPVEVVAMVEIPSAVAALVVEGHILDRLAKQQSASQVVTEGMPGVAGMGEMPAPAAREGVVEPAVAQPVAVSRLVAAFSLHQTYSLRQVLFEVEMVEAPELAAPAVKVVTAAKQEPVAMAASAERAAVVAVAQAHRPQENRAA
jgi:hypothetical protein